MAIEDTLLSIDSSLKTLLLIAQTFGAASSELGKGEFAAVTVTTTKTTRAKKGADAAAQKLLAGDPEGTRYFLIEKHNTVARVVPGETVPSIEGTTEVDADTYSAKKEEFAKKSVTAGAQAAQSTQSAAATTTTAPASNASSSAETVSFKQVVDQLMVLSRDTREGMGRDGVMAFLAKHKVAKVPALEALGKNAELLAEVNALLTPAGDAESDPFA